MRETGSSLTPTHSTSTLFISLRFVFLPSSLLVRINYTLRAPWSNCYGTATAWDHWRGKSIGGASWFRFGGSVHDLQARDRRFDGRLGWICCGAVPLGKAFTQTCTLSWPRSKWVPGRTEPSVCLTRPSFQRRNGSRAGWSSGSWDGLIMSVMKEQVLWPWGNCVTSEK